MQYKTVAYDLEHRRESVSEASEGLQRLVIGLGKKVLIANQMGAIWEDIAAMSGPHSGHGVDRRHRVHVPDLL